MAEIVIVLLLLVLLAEFSSRPRAPRSGVHVISGRMADDYDPPSGSLNPADWQTPPPDTEEGS